MRFLCLNCGYRWNVTYRPVEQTPDDIMWCPKAGVPVVISDKHRGAVNPSKESQRRSFRKGGTTIRVKHRDND